MHSATKMASHIRKVQESQHGPGLVQIEQWGRTNQGISVWMTLIVMVFAWSCRVSPKRGAYCDRLKTIEVATNHLAFLHFPSFMHLAQLNNCQTRTPVHSK
ncbi:hypothetical protein VTP01DRAFT_9814 [Rhizomucor pusillus]|uniref:uncharacterized protein n=1 Tax=Rhizomucor pusillus TaxID=4840 RepID=UPI003744AFD5